MAISTEGKAFSAYITLFQKCSYNQPINLEAEGNTFFYKFTLWTGLNLNCFIFRYTAVSLGVVSCIYVCMGKLNGHFNSIPFWISFLQVMLAILGTYTLWMDVAFGKKGNLLEMVWRALAYQLQQGHSGKYAYAL